MDCSIPHRLVNMKWEYGFDREPTDEGRQPSSAFRPNRKKESFEVCVLHGREEAVEIEMKARQ
jgi:hypothetical protein